MKEELINFETAKLAKQKGFNIPCWNFINIKGEEDEIMGWIGDNFEEKLELAKDFIDYYCPTQALLQKWLREKHNLHCDVLPIFANDPIIPSNWILSRFGITSNMELKKAGIVHKTYEEALEEGLQKNLELI